MTNAKREMNIIRDANKTTSRTPATTAGTLGNSREQSNSRDAIKAGDVNSRRDVNVVGEAAKAETLATPWGLNVTVEKTTATAAVVAQNQ